MKSNALFIRFVAVLVVASIAAVGHAAPMVYIDGDVASGTGKLVISEDLVLAMTSSNDPIHIVLGWETGFGTPNWPFPIEDSEFVKTTGGSLEIDANEPWGSDKFVDLGGNRSNDLTSGPMLLGTGSTTRLYFSDTFQRVRALYQFDRDQMIVRAGEFDLPQIDGFVLPEQFAVSAYLAGVSQYGYPAVSDIISLAPVPEPATMGLLAVSGVALLKRRKC